MKEDGEITEIFECIISNVLGQDEHSYLSAWDLTNGPLFKLTCEHVIVIEYTISSYSLISLL